MRGAGETATCDARRVVEEVSSVLRHEADKRAIVLTVDCKKQSALVAASAEAVNDIVSNLLVNALEATPHGGHVSITLAVGAEQATIRVEDDGPGISDAARDKILQPFFTTKARGTGLGLAIVARRAAEFGGRVEWRSPVQNGRGAIFEISLPVQQIAGEDASKQPA